MRFGEPVVEISLSLFQDFFRTARLGETTALFVTRSDAHFV